jgi:hypothetical protein
MSHVDPHISRKPVRLGSESCRGPIRDSAGTELVRGTWHHYTPSGQ